MAVIKSGSTTDQADVTTGKALKVDASATIQPVSGTINIGNFPSSQAVTGTFWQSIQPVSGTVSVGNFPASQTVNGTVAATQSGSWSFTLGTGSNLVGQIEISDGTNILGTATHPMRIDPTGSTVQPVSFSGSINVGNFPSTQAVTQSGSWTTTVTQATGANLHTVIDSGSVNVGNFPASQAVTGTFFQATQPVSAATLPLPTGASTEATLALIKAKTDNLDVLLSTRTKPADTQTISGSVSVSNFPGTQTVNGTVTANAGTGNFTVVQATAANLNATVTGSVSVSNFPATQTVAGTVTANIGTTNGLALDTSVNGLLIAQAATLDSNKGPMIQGSVTTTAPTYTTGQISPLSLTTAGALRVDGSGSTVTANIGTTNGLALDATVTGGNQKSQIVDGAGHVANVSATGDLNVKLDSIGSGAEGQATMSASIPVVIASDQTPVSISPPAIAKGTQGTTGFTTQDLKDAGRVIKVFTASFTAATTEAMVTLTPITDGTAGATGTTFTVTSGKRFRIQTIMLTCFNATAAIHACQVNLRMSATGSVTTASPIVGTVATTTAAATSNLTTSQAQAFADGLELSGTMQFGISQIGIALAGQTVVLVGYEY